MKRKPIIIIMTSRDEHSGVAERLAREITSKGTHNAVVIDDGKYGSVGKLSLLDRLMDAGQEYQYLLESKDRGVLRDKLKVRKFSKRVNRIGNMLRRFNPEYILCVTPYAHHCAAEAKRKLHSRVKLIYLVISFTAPKRNVDDETDVYIVENPDVKAALTRMGAPSKDVLALGLPYDMPALSASEKAAAKQELGLPAGKTAYISIYDKKQLEQVFALLLDQGNIATLVVRCENQKQRQALGALAMDVPDVNITFIPSKEKADDFLKVSDVAVTSYDVPLIYKCMELGVAPLVIGDDEHIEYDLSYLLSHGLIVRAKEDIEAVGLYYKLLQTDLASQIVANGKKWTENSSTDKIANFLVTFIDV